LVVTFCKKHNLRWGLGRAKKQISDGQHYVWLKTGQRGLSDRLDFEQLTDGQQTPPLTCNVSQIISEHNGNTKSILIRLQANNLLIEDEAESRDTLEAAPKEDQQTKLSRVF
jgi:hypothetical protein